MLTKKERKKLERSFKHTCYLPLKEDILARYISEGWCVYLRRKLTNFVMCSPYSPRAKTHLKSSSAIDFEKISHIRYYTFMIHPYSLARIVWETWMILVYLVLLTYLPLETCLLRVNRSIIPLIVLDTFGWMDNILTFRTGFQHHLTKRITMNPKYVAMNYLKSCFIMDALATLNQDFLALIFGIRTTGWYLQLLSYFRIYRVITTLKYFNRLVEGTQTSLHLLRIVRIFTVLCVLLIWNTCYLCALARYYKEKWFFAKKDHSHAYGMTMSFVRVFCTTFGLTYGGEESVTASVLTAELYLLASGYLLKLFVTGQLSEIVLKYTALGDKYYEIVQQFREYMKTKNLPPSMRQKIFTFLDYRYLREFCNEKELFNSLSEQLQGEINLYDSKRLLRKSVMFKDLPESLITKIASCMNLEIFLPKEVIVTEGIPANTMYFMLTGMVAVYAQNGEEICHLNDGGYFGEAALSLNGQMRSAAVVAIDFCEIYTLSGVQFAKVIGPYPDLLEKVMYICKNLWERLVDDQSTIDILQQRNKHNHDV